MHTAGCGDADVGRSVHVEMVVRGQEGAGERGVGGEQDGGIRYGQAVGELTA
ncbi:MAG TPA: hypothetical protein VIJ00_19500 [Nakamurella sp.]